MKIANLAAVVCWISVILTFSARSESNIERLISGPASGATSQVTTSPETLKLLNDLMLNDTETLSHAEREPGSRPLTMPEPIHTPAWMFDDSRSISDDCELTTQGNITHFAQALQIAICQNPDMRRLAFSLRQYLYEYRKSQSAWMPNINLVLTASSESDRYDMDKADALKQTDRTIDEGVELSWLLFDFGKREALISQKENTWQSQKYQTLSGLQDFILQFAETYYQVLARRTILDAAKDNEQIARKTWDITQNKYRAGVGVLGDALQAENVLLSATQYRIQREGDFQQAMGQLANVLNLSVTRSLEPEDRLGIPAEGQMMSLQPLLDEAIKHHPLILAAQKNKEAAIDQLKQAERDFLPSISLQGGINRNTSSLDQNRYEPIGRTDSMFVGLNVSVPIFAGFKRYNQLNEAHAQYNLSAEEYRSQIKLVELNTWNAWQALNTSNRSVKLISQRLATANRAYAIARGRYLTGVGTIIELLNTQQQLSSTEIDEANVKMEWNLQRLTLLASVGRLSLMQ
ncbi:TolC family protein [Enterobacter roggenkampii]|uniref:TolC family protein n=1 Tax=Enterobacter roggenkampii TaxID=1812935 RepID=UPI00168058A3|nr:TolC family protein [Enterobacter roggenkampii]